MKRDKQYFFCNGAVPVSFITTSMQKCNAISSIGAYSVFLGQVRADDVDNQIVKSIHYTAYEEMALEKMEEIKLAVFKKYPLIEVEVFHSLGEVLAGEICLFVMATAAHRCAAMEACNELVEKVKSELPIWGKECFETIGYQWKTNN